MTAVNAGVWCHLTPGSQCSTHILHLPPALPFFSPLLQSSLKLRRDDGDVPCMEENSKLTMLIPPTTMNLCSYPCSLQKETSLTKLTAVLFYRRKHGYSTGTSWLLSRAIQPMTSQPLGFWQGLWYQTWILSPRAGLKSNENWVGGPRNRFATVAPVNRFWMANW